MSVLALVPARSGSKGIPGKNFRPLGGRSLMNRAIDLCNEMRGTLSDFVVSSDIDWAANERYFGHESGWRYGRWLLRPAELAQDDTPMIAVVQHALEAIPGPDDQIVLLLQPTQPFRTPEHLTQAIALLEESGADSVVSVVELPKTHSPDMLCAIHDGGRQLMPWDGLTWPTRRQDARTAYKRDGTVYAFRRATVREFDNIYGVATQPLIIPPEQSCELDTEADWAEVVRRWDAAPRS